jgi:uncharacterized Zn finger protein (UPF0148 family)
VSLWTCPEHGLYGGDVFCPRCGKNGAYTTVEADTRAQPAPADVVERVARALYEHEWQGQPHPEGFSSDRAYWMDAAKAALAAIPVSGEVERFREALTALLDRYTELVNSGDAGFWDPEEEDEVKLARQALTPPRSIRVSDLTDEEVEAMRK